LSEIEKLKKIILEFRDERNWEQFHSIKHLISALSIEASELAELFLWKNEADINEALKDKNFREDIMDECADVFNYLILIATKLDFDLTEAANNKIKKNKEKYPISKSKGISTKYNKLNDNN